MFFNFIRSHKKTVAGLVAGLLLAGGVAWAQTSVEWRAQGLLFRVANPFIAYAGTLTFQSISGAFVYGFPAPGVPTCGMANGLGGMIVAAGSCGVTNNAGVSRGSDFAARILLGANNQNAIGTLGSVLVVTFANTYLDVPACVAMYDSPGKYGYYIYAVTPSTTGVLIKLGVPAPFPLTPAVASFSPGDNVNLICSRTL